MSIKIGEVTEFVNRMRSAIGKPPLEKLPKGKPCANNQCPIALALDSPNVGNAYIQLTDQEQQDALAKLGCERYEWAGGVVEFAIATPPLLQDFIKAFDKGELEELIDGGGDA